MTPNEALVYLARRIRVLRIAEGFNKKTSWGVQDIAAVEALINNLQPRPQG